MKGFYNLMTVFIHLAVAFTLFAQSLAFNDISAAYGACAVVLWVVVGAWAMFQP